MLSHKAISEFKTPSQSARILAMAKCIDQLYSTIEIANISMIQQYMMYDENVHTIEYAINEDKMELLKFLLTVRDYTDREYYKFIIRAVKCNSIKVFKGLFETKEYLDRVLNYYHIFDVDGWSIENPLEILLYRLLSETACSGNLELVKMLCDAGASPSELAEHAHYCMCQKPIVRASNNGHMDVVMYLLDRGADISSDLTDLFLDACTYGCVDLMRVLVGYTDDEFNAIELYGFMRNCHKSIVEYFNTLIPEDGLWEDFE